MVVFESKYKDLDCIVIENEHIKAIYVLYGAKMVSLICKQSGKELLWQNPNRFYQVPNYLDEYNSGDFSGFDEMFPTITACECEEYPFEGVHLPDHGEVWSREWNMKILANALVFEINGLRLPYHLKKTVSFDKTGALVMEYEAANQSEFDLRYIWASHPLFVLENSMKIGWDKSKHNLIITANKSGKLGTFGDIVTNTAEFVGNGLNNIENDDYLKYYLVGNDCPNVCFLEYDDDTRLELEFQTENNVCLGFWINKGGLRGQYNIATEFCTASMDNVVASKKFGSNCVLKGEQSDKWRFILSVSKGVQDDS